MPKLHLLVLNLSHRVGFYAARTPGKQWSKKTTVLICREQRVKPRKTSNIIIFLKLNQSIKHCKLMFSQPCSCSSSNQEPEAAFCRHCLCKRCICQEQKKTGLERDRKQLLTKFKERGNRTLQITGNERENQRLEENSDYTFFWGYM